MQYKRLQNMQQYFALVGPCQQLMTKYMTCSHILQRGICYENILMQFVRFFNVGYAMKIYLWVGRLVDGLQGLQVGKSSARNWHNTTARRTILRREPNEGCTIPYVKQIMFL